MFGSFLRVVAALALVAVLAGIGISVYNAGVNEGLTQAAIAAQAAGEDPAVVVPPYAGGPYGYGYGWGHGWGGPGFGFFGFLFGILILFLIFGLVRAAFGWGRWGGGGRGPGGWRADREERIAELHRELHKRDTEPSTG
jgi:uncharacterized membrane protein